MRPSSDQLLRAIVATLDGQEWDADTMAEIVDLLRTAGYSIADVDDYDDDRAEIDEWDAPACLRWLADNVPGPHHYAARADDWAGEVARFAAYEHTTPDAWEQTATEELRAAVRAAWRDDTDPKQEQT